MKSCLAQYATFSGRARRSEYWFFLLFELLAYLAAGALIYAGVADSDWNAAGTFVIFLAIVWFGFVLPHLAVSVRRFHDLGQTGWLVLVFSAAGLIPAIGIVAYLANFVWFSFRGTVGSNRFGPDPYGEQSTFYEQIFS